MGIDTEIDDGLTDEERAALEDEEGGDDEGGGDENEDTGTDDSGDDDADAGADDEAADDAGQQNAEGGESDAGQQGGEAAESAPIFVAQPPEGADTKLAEIATQKDELFSKFDDGDITAKEYQAELDKLNKQEREIEWGIEKAKLAAEMEAQRQANEWKSTVEQFIRDNPRYSPEKNDRLYKLLDMEVRQVAVSDEFKGRTDATAGREILQKAHENIAEALGFEAKPQTNKPNQKIKKPDLPPNLANVPAADQNDTNGGKYAVLDRLAANDPIGYEEALMKLSESERNAYLAS